MRGKFIVDVPIVNTSDNPTPVEPATPQSAGIDLRYAGEDFILEPLQRKLCDTGLKMAIPNNHVGLVFPRSGMALKQGICLANCVGVIDADYRNNIGVILINLSDKPSLIQHGDRIAQLVIVEYNKPHFNEVDTLDSTERGEGGFGHSGVK